MYREIKDISRVKRNNEIYGKDQFFSKKKQNLITSMYYKNSIYLENSHDNSGIQILIFSLRLLFVTKEKKSPPAICLFTRENNPLSLMLFGKPCLW